MRYNRNDGETIPVDLSDPDDARTWHEVEDDPEAQAAIRAVALNGHGPEVTVTRPRRFRDVRFVAEACGGKEGEIVADRVTVQADDVELDVLLYRSGVTRVSLRRIGRPRFLAKRPRGGDHGRRQ